MDNALNYLKYKGTVTGGDYESDEVRHITDISIVRKKFLSILTATDDSVQGCQPYELHACGYPQKMPCSSATSLTPKCKRHNCTNEYYDKYEKNIHKSKRSINSLAQIIYREAVQSLEPVIEPSMIIYS